MRRRGEEVRIWEPQIVQGCKKIEPVAFKVNSYKEGVLRRGFHFRKKGQGITWGRAI
jgi:hypothetical protein